jgi:hypothetical protein
MITLEVDSTVILEQQRALEAALSTNPKTQKALQKLIRKVIMEARAKVVSAARVKMDKDPRGAAQAVRTVVYKKILGANINIFSSRKAHGQNSYEPPRKGVSGRGGNRRTRSPRTRQIMNYAPLDRGFILRWINDGTPGARNIQFKSNDRRKADKWNKHPNTGNRGNIAPRNFFRGAGERALAQAADNLANLIDNELEAMLNKKKK